MRSSAAPMFSRLIDGLPWWIVAVLVLGLGAVFARLTWTITFPDAPVIAQTENDSTPAAKRQESEAPAAILAKLSPFGEEETADRPPKVRESSLAIRLRGVITGPAPLAMIEVAGGVELRQTGEPISDDVVIHAIEPERIVVDNGGRLESIDLPGSGQVTLNNVQAAAGTSSDRPSLSELMTAPERLLDLINVAAERSDGRVIGYRVNSRPGRERLLQQVGLADGDVITHIADAPLSDPGNLARLMDRLNQGKQIAVRIERDGDSIETMIDTGTFQ